MKMPKYPYHKTPNSMKNYLNKIKKSALVAVAIVGLFSQNLFAQEATTAASSAPAPYDLIRYVLLALAFVMLIAIYVLSKTAITAAKNKLKKAKGVMKILAIVFLSGISLTANQLQAQEAAAGAAKKSSFDMIYGIPWDIWVIFLAIVAMSIMIVSMTRTINKLLREEKAAAAETEVKQGFDWNKFFVKFNKGNKLEDEAKIDLDHNYDGIRELDNQIPPWFSWSFYATIVFALIYLYRFFISGAMPNQFEELNAQNERGAIEKANFLKQEAANIDETSVVMLGAADIEEGHKLFEANCKACHGANGEGNTIGPNLTDDYWLYKGSLNDIFTTIKYGRPNGMQAWNDQFTPKQIAQLSSFVKSLKGSNPPGAKAPQGELYVDEGSNKGGEATSDASVSDNTVTADSTNI